MTIRASGHESCRCNEFAVQALFFIAALGGAQKCKYKSTIVLSTSVPSTAAFSV